MPISRRHALACLVVVALAGCGGTTTSVTQLWKAPIAIAPMKSVIVFGANLDEANRRVLEDSYVAALSERGLAAKQSYTLFPGEPPARDAAREAVKNAGFDGILVSQLRNVREKQSYVPGADNGFWSAYYGSGWAYWNPGYIVTDELVAFDTTLWDTRAGDQLVAALTTETKNPSSDKDFVRSLTTSVVKALDEQRFIPPKRQP